MSKPRSYLFSGTAGAKIASYTQPIVQKELVTTWATAEAQRLTKISKRQRDKFKTACIAVDEETGNRFYGRNAGIDRNGINQDGQKLHKLLVGSKDTSGILPAVSLNAYPTVLNCAETDAINKALHAGAKLENIHIYTIDTTQSSFGKDKTSCLNCTAAYKNHIKRNNTGWTEE